MTRCLEGSGDLGNFAEGYTGGLCVHLQGHIQDQHLQICQNVFFKGVVEQRYIDTTEPSSHQPPCPTLLHRLSDCA